MQGSMPASSRVAGARERAAGVGASTLQHTADEVGDNLHFDAIRVGVGLRSAVVDVHSAEVA